MIYKEESEIPKILRRRETNPSKEGETVLLFHHGSEDHLVYTKNIFTNGCKSYSVRTLVCELPSILRNKRNKEQFKSSSNLFFGRKVSEMNHYFKNELYYTIISLCQEIASTPLEDHELRLRIVQNYYGKKRDTESVENYLFNFRTDVFDSIALFY
jgi:hypothetical protein